MRLIPQKKCNFKKRQRRTARTRVQPYSRSTYALCVTERRFVTQSPLPLASGFKGRTTEVI
jgi:hypothetical protein